MSTRDLHPFPTRRSSDLTPSQSPSAPSGSGPQASDGGLTFAITGVENAPTVKYQDAPVEKKAQGEFVIVHMKVLNSSGDRKSTRLNSSHRCISYAVFCLK